MKKQKKSPINNFLEKSKDSSEFLKYLGIDPKDFEDDFYQEEDLEFDDYSK